MAIYYKFKSAKDFSAIPISGSFVSVVDLKRQIIAKKCFNTGRNYDLLFTDTSTQEEYVSGSMLIPNHTSVIVRRVPTQPHSCIRVQDERPKGMDSMVEDVSQIMDSSKQQHDDFAWDDFGEDIYATPEKHNDQSSNPAASQHVQNKVHASIKTPPLDLQGQPMVTIASRSFEEGSHGASPSKCSHLLNQRTPPKGYVCYRCNIVGHFIQHCPTNGDPKYDLKASRPLWGAKETQGSGAACKPDGVSFEKETLGLPLTYSLTGLHPELQCPLCKEFMKDAVMSKCCFRSFCARCIRDQLLSKLTCVCGAKNLSIDNQIPNNTLRKTITRILKSTTNSSSEKIRDLRQDTQSSRQAPADGQTPPISTNMKSSHPSNCSTHTPKMEQGSENEGCVSATMVQHSGKDVRHGSSCDVASAKGGGNVLASQETTFAPSKQLSRKKRRRACIPEIAFSNAQWNTSGYPDSGLLTASSCNPYYVDLVAASSCYPYYAFMDAVGVLGPGHLNAPLCSPYPVGTSWTVDGQMAASPCMSKDAFKGQTYNTHILPRSHGCMEHMKSTKTNRNRSQDAINDPLKSKPASLMTHHETPSSPSPATTDQYFRCHRRSLPGDNSDDERHFKRRRRERLPSSPHGRAGCWGMEEEGRHSRCWHGDGLVV